MAEKKQVASKLDSKYNKITEETESKMNELKIELLKQKSKRKDIKKEIARLLTFNNINKVVEKK